MHNFINIVPLLQWLTDILVHFFILYFHIYKAAYAARKFEAKIFTSIFLCCRLHLSKNLNLSVKLVNWYMVNMHDEISYFFSHWAYCLMLQLQVVHRIAATKKHARWWRMMMIFSDLLENKPTEPCCHWLCCLVTRTVARMKDAFLCNTFLSFRCSNLTLLALAGIYNSFFLVKNWPHFCTKYSTDTSVSVWSAQSCESLA